MSLLGLSFIKTLKRIGLKMKFLEFLLVSVCIFELCLADLDIFGCTNQLGEYMSCSTDKDAYAKPFPAVVDTILELRSINTIDENKNSLTIQVTLICTWKDPGIFIKSNISK